MPFVPLLTRTKGSERVLGKGADGIFTAKGNRNGGEFIFSLLGLSCVDFIHSL